MLHDRVHGHDGLPIYNGHRHPPNQPCGTDQILRLYRADPNSRVLAISAKCIQCRTTADAIRVCADTDCGLHRLRPFQLAEAKSAPHITRLQPTDGPCDVEEFESE